MEGDQAEKDGSEVVIVYLVAFLARLTRRVQVFS